MPHESILLKSKLKKHNLKYVDFRDCHVVRLKRTGTPMAYASQNDGAIRERKPE